MKKNSPTDTSAGLTLIELVVVMAVFAMVAVMGVQSLTGTLRISDRLRVMDSDTASLGTGLALLRNDLTAVVSMSFYPPGESPQAAVWQNPQGNVIGLSLAGQPGLGRAVTDLHRAEWRFDPAKQHLLRRHWPTLLPVEGGQLGGETVVFENVSGVVLRTWWEGVGWVEGAAPPLGAILISTATSVDTDGSSAGAVPAAYFSNIPNALEIVLQTRQSGDIRIIQSLK